MQQGKNLITPSLRVSWLGAGFLGGEPAKVVSSSSGSQATLATGLWCRAAALACRGNWPKPSATTPLFILGASPGCIPVAPPGTLVVASSSDWAATPGSWRPFRPLLPSRSEACGEAISHQSFNLT
jgi:hypothetical protein